MKDVNAPNCERQEDLVSYLYDELNEAEARNFQLHINNCRDCKAELANFQDVRKSVIAWRNESLAGVALTPEYANAQAATMESKRPSAIAAFREFFSLSPLWLKGAVAFASILFCLFAGLAIARLQQTPAPTVVMSPPSSGPSEAQLNAMVERRVQEELQRTRQTSQPAPEVVASDDSTVSHRKIIRSGTAINPIQEARRPLSKSERAQLAADLRLVAARNESEIDLLDDGINQ